MKGGYEQMDGCYAAVTAWAGENGYQSAGPMFNICHVSPHETQDPEGFVTGVCYPVG